MTSEVDPPSESPESRARTARLALVGTTLADRYALRRLVGQGGMGAVYEAEQLGLGRSVAVKLVDPEFATDERFAREARAMSAVESAHIVTVLDAGTSGGRPFLVMELLRGEDLGERLRRTQRVPLPDALHVVAQVLKGLASAHAAGIVHRDLKPDNVFLLQRDGDPLFSKIVDFGLSKIERPQNRTSPLALTGRGTVLGTPLYMSPEQAQAAPDIDARADLYSVGAILFECLTGRPPHTGETYEQVILSICMRDAPDVRAFDPAIPAEVSAFVARALARDRDVRFASANRMLAALHDLAPRERTRVPLELSTETLLSAGAGAPVGAGAVDAAPFDGAKTYLHGSAMAAPSASPPARRKDPGALTLPAGSAEARALIPGVSSAPASRGEAHGGSTLVSGPGEGPFAESAPEPARARPASRAGARPMSRLVATAVAALALGGVAMFAVISLLDDRRGKGDDGPPSATVLGPSTSSSALTSAPTIASVLASSSASATAPVASSSSPPPSSSAPGAPSAPPASSARTAPPGAGGAKPRPAGTKLDIARDLPP